MTKKKKPQPTKKDLVSAVLAKMVLRYGKRSALRLSDGSVSDVAQVIPTGISVLDHHVFGIGGLPCGRMVEVASEEGSGKSSLLYAAIAGVQAAGGEAFLAETEQGLQTSRPATFGVDPRRVGLLEPDHLQAATGMIELTLRSIPRGNRKPVLIGWDSLAATPLREELEEGLTDSDAIVGLRARHLSLACRVIAKLAAERNACVLIVNQVRERIGVVFGDKWTTPGGKAVKFLSSFRLQILGGKAVKAGANGVHVAKVLTVLASKNKLAPPWRKARVRLDYATGWNEVWSTLEFAKTVGCMDAAEVKERGVAAAYEEALKLLDWPRSLLADAQLATTAVAEAEVVEGDPAPAPAADDAAPDDAVDDGAPEAPAPPPGGAGE